VEGLLTFLLVQSEKESDFLRDEGAAWNLDRDVEHGNLDADRFLARRSSADDALAVVDESLHVEGPAESEVIRSRQFEGRVDMQPVHRGLAENSVSGDLRRLHPDHVV